MPWWPPPNKRKLRQRPLPAHDAFPHHAGSGVSLTTINVLVTCNATYRCGLCDNNCGLRNFKRTVSTGYAHSTLNDTSFAKQSVSTTNLVSGYIRECIGDLLLSFLSFLSTMWEHCCVCRREGANKGHYYSFKIFPQFWLAKSTRIIHHNQLLMTKFGRIWCLTRKWRQKCSLLRVKAPLTEKTRGRGWVVFAVKTKMADTSLVSRVRTTAGTRRNNG